MMSMDALIPTVTLDEVTARGLVDRVRAQLDDIAESVAMLWHGRGWVPLGYGSWEELCAAELKFPRMTKGQRIQLVGGLRAIGMSQRAIGAAVGVSKDTVNRDLGVGVSNATPEKVTGLDGKEYGATRPTAKPEPEPEPELDLGPTPSKSEPKKRAPTKPDLGDGVSHPARYSSELLPVFAELLADYNCTNVLDPFAGTGRIHELRPAFRTIGIELEPEWADMSEHTIVGSALELPFDDGSFSAVCTSPTYGNRLADSHNASDPERRRSYTHDLGRQLSGDNSGALQWGDEYREFHLNAWAEARRVLANGGLFILNIKDHVRDGLIQEVSFWHMTALQSLGFSLDRMPIPVGVPSMRAGANARARVDYEWVIALVKP